MLSYLLGGLRDGVKTVGNTLSEVSSFINLVKVGHLEMRLRPDDIFIVTYPRSGTTWMQMILYQLTSDGSMAFDHICQKVPWFERSLFFDLMETTDFETMPSPRLFKSHLSWFWIPKGPCRYIYVYRNGMDVALSYYHFYTSHLSYQGSFNDFFKKFMAGDVQYRSWFRHVKAWQDHAHLSNVFMVKYEDLISDLEGTLGQLIAFLHLDVSKERIPAILHRCSFDYMKEHEKKFDHIHGMQWEKKLKNNAFIRKGAVGKGKETLSISQQEAFNRVYASYFTP